MVHASFVLAVGMPVLPGLHPRMANEEYGPTVVRQLEPPGFLGLNYGYRTPLSVLLAHLLYGVGAVMSPEVGEAIKALFSRVEERMAPWTAEHSLLAFAEQRPDLRGCFPAAAAERLERIKADRDPDGLILANHSDA